MDVWKLQEARIADLALPREILVSEELVAHAGAGLRFEPAGRRMLKGFDAPVFLYPAGRSPCV